MQGLGPVLTFFGDCGCGISKNNLTLCFRAGGELFERITAKGTFSEAEAAHYFRQMVEVRC